MVGAPQIVFGTDHPFGSSSNIASAMRNVGFSAEELRGVDRENGFRILPKYKS